MSAGGDDDFPRLSFDQARRLMRMMRTAHGRDRAEREEMAFDWCRASFGADRATDLPHRATRFLEEAAELAQAVGMSHEQARRVIDHVFAQPAGDPQQEVGGAGVTLLVLARAIGIRADEAEAAELLRVLSFPRSHWQRRNAAKDAAGLGPAPDAAP